MGSKNQKRIVVTGSASDTTLDFASQNEFAAMTPADVHIPEILLLCSDDALRSILQATLEHAFTRDCLNRPLGIGDYAQTPRYLVLGQIVERVNEFNGLAPEVKDAMVFSGVIMGLRYWNAGDLFLPAHPQCDEFWREQDHCLADFELDHPEVVRYILDFLGWVQVGPQDSFGANYRRYISHVLVQLESTSGPKLGSGSDLNMGGGGLQ